MTVAPGEFIRRFLLHVLPKGFHRIRHYGLLAGSKTKADRFARARELITEAAPATSAPKAQEGANLFPNACLTNTATVAVVSKFRVRCTAPRQRQF
jgi:Putative transposase